MDGGSRRVSEGGGGREGGCVRGREAERGNEDVTKGERLSK